MKKISFLIAAFSAAIVTGCGSSSSGSSNKRTQMTPSDVNSYPKYELTQANKDDIAYMGNEERLAFDIYTYLYNYHISNSNIAIEQLNNIASNSETIHIKEVRDLVNKYQLSSDDLTILTTKPVASSETLQQDLPLGEYDIDHIQNLYNDLKAKGENSYQDALEVGCVVEVTDINDLNPKIDRAIESGAKDLEDIFKFLRDGSYNHYWAFDKGLKSLGIEDGCCSLGNDWCHLEYPQK